MKGLVFILLFLMMFSGNESNDVKYYKPVSQYNLETGKWERDSTGKWNIYKNDRLGPTYLQLRTYAKDELKDRLSFYVFDNDAEARQAFHNMADTMYSISVNEEDRIVGYDGGVCDAEIESLRFLDGNVIMYAQLGVYSAWAVNASDYAPPKTDDEIMGYVLEHHEYLRDYANQKIQWIISCKNE